MRSGGAVRRRRPSSSTSSTRFELRLRYGRSFERTERRAADRDDPAAPARRATSPSRPRRPARTFRDGARVEHLELGAAGVTATVGGERGHAPTSLVGADGANGIVAKAAGLGRRRSSAASRSRATSPWDAARPRALRARPPSSSSARPPAATAGCSRRATTPTSASAAGGAKARACATISRGSRAAYGSIPDALTDVRGHRLPMRRARRLDPCARPRRSSSATPPGSSIRSRATGCTRRSSPRGSPPRRSSPATRRLRRRARRGARPPRGRLVGGEARARPAPRGLFLGRALARACSASSPASSRATSASGRGARARAAAAEADRAARAPSLEPTLRLSPARRGKGAPLACRCSST